MQSYRRSFRIGFHPKMLSFSRLKMVRSVETRDGSTEHAT